MWLFSSSTTRQRHTVLSQLDLQAETWWAAKTLAYPDAEADYTHKKTFTCMGLAAQAELFKNQL